MHTAMHTQKKEQRPSLVCLELALVLIERFESHLQIGEDPRTSLN